MTASERNEHYRALNERFDERAHTLCSMGFKYMKLDNHPVAAFTLVRPGCKPHMITSSLVMYADDVVWEDTCQDAQRYVIV